MELLFEFRKGESTNVIQCNEDSGLYIAISLSLSLYIYIWNYPCGLGPEPIVKVFRLVRLVLAPAGSLRMFIRFCSPAFDVGGNSTRGASASHHTPKPFANPTLGSYDVPLLASPFLLIEIYSPKVGYP